jgi:hypothetical protein
MTTQIVGGIKLAEKALVSTQKAIVSGIQSVREQQASLNESALAIVSHCQAVQSFAALNDTCKLLVEAGEETGAACLRSWAARAFTGTINDRTANEVRLTQKAVDAGGNLDFAPEFKAAPKALLIQESKTRGGTKEKRVLKASDIKTLHSRMKNGFEGMTDEQAATIKAQLDAMMLLLNLV